MDTYHIISTSLLIIFLVDLVARLLNKTKTIEEATALRSHMQRWRFLYGFQQQEEKSDLLYFRTLADRTEDHTLLIVILALQTCRIEMTSSGVIVSLLMFCLFFYRINLTRARAVLNLFEDCGPQMLNELVVKTPGNPDSSAKAPLKRGWKDDWGEWHED